MHSPWIDASSTPSPPTLHDTAPRQRLKGALSALPPADSAPFAHPHPPAPQPLSSADLVDPVQRINSVMRQHGLEFDLSDERVVTRVIDRESGELIRQIPAEEVLRIAERLNERQGNLVSSRA
ncbi:flagellar protein FlaG [Halomonas cibimaris]|uniref:Flagellar protein FlaG n=1 Tax=Halomonas cibimaris TaxID=657012 RepID=A0ABP7LPW1_9GAMM